MAKGIHGEQPLLWMINYYWSQFQKARGVGLFWSGKSGGVGCGRLLVCCKCIMNF